MATKSTGRGSSTVIIKSATTTTTGQNENDEIKSASMISTPCFKKPIPCQYYRKLRRPYEASKLLGIDRRPERTDKKAHHISEINTTETDDEVDEDSFIGNGNCRIWEREKKAWKDFHNQKKLVLTVTIEEQQKVPLIVIRRNRDIVSYIRITNQCRIRQNTKKHMILVELGSSPPIKIQFFGYSTFIKVVNEIQAKIDGLKEMHKKTKGGQGQGAGEPSEETEKQMRAFGLMLLKTFKPNPLDRNMNNYNTRVLFCAQVRDVYSLPLEDEEFDSILGP